MNPDPNRVAAIFAAAVTRLAEARAAYLDEACGNDAELRRRVEALLQAHDDAGSFLEKPAAAASLTTNAPSGQWMERDAAPALAEGPGSRIGPYKLLQQIGEGGMGVVYMAEQESPVRRRVALKIIKPGMDSAQVIARFESERQALAMMDHPNIAKVLDAGATESSRPYFVMELVYGVPITTFCDDNHLTPRQRLELFVPICQAIQHAHQKGIIHRDIKPSNVLVTMHDDKPVPKVIDFGVAKAVEQRLTEKSLFTAFGAVVGTLEYMSPEQAEMNAFGVDTRSDVYSLGVLLYELLTGTTPLERKRLRQAAYTEVLRLIKEEEPPRPSVRLSSSGDLPKIAAARKTEPARLSRVVRGEIDWIVMRCLEKDRTRRYESASALARDVERYLRDEAVEACPPSVGYRLRKFARKYRVMLSTAAAFVLLLLIASGVSIWLAVVAEQAEADAKEKRQEAENASKQAVQERDRAQKEWQRAEDAANQAKANAAEARRALNQYTAAKGIELTESGDLFRALSWFVKPLERGGLPPEEELIHRTRIACYLRHTPGRPTLRQVLFPSGPVHHAAWSADAKRVLTVSENVVQVWDVASGEAVATLPHSGYVSTAQFMPDGSRIRTVAEAAIWTWDAGSGRLLGLPLRWGREIYPPQPLWLLPRTPLQLLCNIAAQPFADYHWRIGDGSYARLEISRDGRRALFSYKSVLRLLDLEARKPIQQWTVNEESSWGNKSTLGPDGRWVLLIKDGSAIAHDTAMGKSVPLSVKEDGPIEAVALSTDGTRALTFGKDNTIRFWNATTWQPLARMSNPDRVSRQYAQFSPDNRFVAAWGGWIGGLRDLALWDVESGRLVREMPDNFLDLAGFDWRADSQQFLRVSKQGEVALWDISEKARPAAIQSHGREVNLAVYGPDARTLLTATNEGEVRIWDLGGGNQPFTLKPLEKNVARTRMQLAWAITRGGWTRSSFKASELGLLAEIGQRQIKQLLPSGTVFDYGALSPDRSRVLTSHLESEKSANAKSIQLWDAKTGRRLGKPLQSTSPFNCAAFSDDSRLVVAASEDGTVYLLDARTGALAGRPLKHGGNVLYSTFSPDGALLVTCGMDQSARLWRTRTGQPVGERLRHEAPVTLAGFSPDSKTVATASLDGVVRIWDGRGAPLGMLKSGHVEGLLFHPSGLLLVVTTGDEMRLWDVASQQDVVSAMVGRSDKRGFSLLFDPHIKTGGRFVINREFDLPSDDRPAGDLIGLSQLYSGRRLDAKAGAVPLDKNERQVLWRRLYAKYPEEFTVSAKAAVDWRIEQLQSASERPAAVAFHRRWLAAELAEAGWQPDERGNEDREQDHYLQRLYALALYGNHAAAIDAANALAARWPKDSDTQYNCACVCALAAGAVKGDASLADRYAARAVALLRQAVKAGYKDEQHIRKDPDLDALRRREDFLQLQRDLSSTR